MKSRGLFLALGILGILIGLIIWDEKRSTQEEEAKEQQEKILQFSSDKAVSVILTNNQGEIVLQRDTTTKNWKITKPLAADADSEVVNGILESLSSEKYDQIASEGGEDPKTYGLADSKVSISIQSEGGPQKKITLGMDSPLTGKLYLKREEDGKVLFASSSIRQQIEKTLKDVRDKRVLRFEKEKISHLQIENHRKDNNSKIHLARNEKGEWVLQGPITENADGDLVVAFLNALEGLRAMDFASENSKELKEQKRLGLDQPQIQIVGLDKEKKTLFKFLISPKKDNFAFVMVEGKAPIYQVYSAILDQINRKPDDFRDKRAPFELGRGDVNSISLKTGIATIDVVQKGDKWESVKPLEKDKEVNQAQVAKLLDQIEGMKVGRFLGVQPGRGLNPPRGQLTLKNQKGELLLDLIWGEKISGQNEYYLKSSKGKETYGVDQSAIDGLPAQTLIGEKGINEAKALPTAPELPPGVDPHGEEEEGEHAH